MRFLAIAFGVAACTGPRVTNDVTYDDRFGAQTTMDVYEPADDTPTPRPAVLVIHGGSWRTPTKRSSMAADAERLADAGYVAFNIDYRLVPDGGEFPHAVQDCFCALAYIRAHAADWNIDPARIAGMGYSAGGHLGSMLAVAAADPVIAPDCAAGTTGPLVAMVSGAGPQDMRLFPQVAAVTEFVGGTKAEVPERYIQASPITHVVAGAPPFLMIHGTGDIVVNIEHSRDMRAALRAVGTDARLLEIPGGGHLFNRDVDGGDYSLVTANESPEAWAATIDFLDRTIGPVR
ncbi:MAG: alpha/beta hydrolase [Deltaproteobacteria bacterium]|nr:alpha/beta hydrolase [Deltaproteobacteria bacterium]